MNCEETGEWFGVYRDLPEDSTERLAVDLHVKGCRECSEEFSMWEQSALLIHEFPIHDGGQEEFISSDWVNENVMNRIYTEQSWYMPAVRRTYSFSFAFRRKVAGILAALLAIFVCGFLYTSFGHVSGINGDGSNVMKTAEFSVNHQFSDSEHLNIPLASISEPYMLNVTPAMPEYWVALSMLGMIMTLLILNWFSRVRS
jgi:hypothetical protein